MESTLWMWVENLLCKIDLIEILKFFANVMKEQLSKTSMKLELCLLLVKETEVHDRSMNKVRNWSLDTNFSSITYGTKWSSTNYSGLGRVATNQLHNVDSVLRKWVQCNDLVTSVCFPNRKCALFSNGSKIQVEYGHRLLLPLIHVKVGFAEHTEHPLLPNILARALKICRDFRICN